LPLAQKAREAPRLAERRGAPLVGGRPGAHPETEQRLVREVRAAALADETHLRQLVADPAHVLLLHVAGQLVVLGASRDVEGLADARGGLLTVVRRGDQSGA